MAASLNSIKSTSGGAWSVSSSSQICYKMLPCMPLNLFGPLRSFDVGVSRFKRVGPNAMRGRGIGTARGRATIMRGLLLAFFPS